MRRNVFLLSAASLVAFPRAARATGGLDSGAPETATSIRVLLASGAFVPPESIDAWHFAWNGRHYRGTFATVTLPDGRAGLVTTVPLDAYLYGVLGREISASWVAAAQQAQAIVSRTYALGRLRPLKPYDVVASEGDQQYGGIESESVECRAAIDATAAQIVTFGGLPARVAYSACCGGRTADAADVWKTPYPYLTSVVDPNCAAAPNYIWSAGVDRDDLARAFGRRLADIGALRDVRLDAANPDARPNGIAFLGATASFETSPADVRNALGTSLVRSTFVRSATLAPGGASLALTGTGRGHGVGMCQWGARALGENGATAAAIVAFYFPGTALGIA